MRKKSQDFEDYNACNGSEDDRATIRKQMPLR
jgi:hypothetical protein